MMVRYDLGLVVGRSGRKMREVFLAEHARPGEMILAACRDTCTKTIRGVAVGHGRC